MLALTARACTAVVAMLALSGCASIAEFSVTPTHICPGEKVLAHWDVTTGSPTLTAAPGLAGGDAVAKHGERSFTPVATTRFVLRAQALFKPAQVERDVTVLPPTAALTFGGVAACSADSKAVALVLTIPDDVAARSGQIVSLTNLQQRQLDVAKQGVRATIAAGTSTDAFRQVALAGTWNLQSAVNAGESCDSVLSAMAHRLSITTNLSCGGQ